MDDCKPIKHDKEHPAVHWESVVDKQIREAMERGEFDNLLGQGEPLNLNKEPHTPPEWDAAFRMLREAGFAPEWIEQDKEIRAAKAEIFKPFRNYLQRRGKLPSDRSAVQARLIAEFRRKAGEVNRLIDDFNLKAPSIRLHHARIRVEEEIANFAASAEGRE